MEVILHWVGTSCTGRRGRWVVVGISAVIVALGIQQAVKLPIGYTEPGSPLLWQDSDFNVSSRHINDSYGGNNELVVYLEGDHDDAMKDPALLGTLDNFSHYMLEQSQASGTRSTTSLLRGVTSLFHYNDPKWQVYPETMIGVGQMLFMYEAGAPTPGVILQFMDYRAKNGQFVVYYKDTQGSTVLEAIERAKAFIAAHPLPHVKFILAGGSIGITAALNDEIAYSDRVSTLLILFVVFALVAISYMSFVAGAMVLIT
jgi:predicted RND superfamily exporter protein